MPKTSPERLRLLLMPLRQEQDVVLCRNRARSIAKLLALSEREQVQVATAVSEIARNAFRYATGGSAEFLLVTGQNELGRAVIEQLDICIEDKGPGIGDLASILAGRYQSSTGLGMGITGAHRLMDAVDIKTGSNGTTVRLSKNLDHPIPAAPEDLRRITESISEIRSVEPLEELATQNRELIRALEEIQVQREQVQMINNELSETNRGVVALYDELDTIYRVGHVVASKLDLESLLQAITDATTEVSGAEFGAFFCRETETGRFTCQTVAGPLGSRVRAVTPAGLNDLIGCGSDSSEVLRIDDILSSGVPNPIGDDVPLRSYLSVAVRDSNSQLVGALVFGHSTPAAFTERSERILTSVAVQASIGLENAQLYRNVQAASAAKDQFLAVLSHELRTPLNPVFAVLAALESNENLPADIRPDLLIMRRNLQLEARLIDDLLDLTRIVKGTVPLQREVVDVHELVLAAQQTCEVAIVKQKINIELQLEADRHHVYGDAARLQQVLWNLLNNAVKFTASGGTVRVSTELRNDSGLSIRITDTGRGIERDALEKIFRPFEQADISVPARFGGLGLGLAISKSIVDAHGGTIRAESEGPNRGASFIFTLPLAKDGLPDLTKVRPTHRPEKRTTPSRILLVDDHEDTRETMRRLLNRRGHEVTTAGSCKEAIQAVTDGEFDLVISDLGLPDGSGHDLMPELRRLGVTTGIALSGFGMEADVERSHHAGFYAHLTKPLDFAVLEATIEKALATA